MNRYRASAALERIILSSAPRHYATPSAPMSLDQLKASANDPKGLPVWDGGCQRTIFSRPEVNHAFRAWHDAIHLELDAPFDGLGEAAVCALSVIRLTEAGASAEDCDAIIVDIWGQYRYSIEHGGAFPHDQAAFVASAMQHGINHASRLSF